MAAKKATAVIPIVFAAAGDPVGTGLVASLARPGGNITGLSIQQTDLASKRLEILREVPPRSPHGSDLGHYRQPKLRPGMGEAQAAARTLGLAAVTSEVQRAEDIAPAFDALKGRADGLYVCSSLHFCRPIGFELIAWRWACDGRPYTAFGHSPRREV